MRIAKKSLIIVVLILLSIQARAQEDLFTALQPLVDKKVEFVSKDGKKYAKFEIKKNRFKRPTWIVPSIRYSDEKEFKVKDKDALNLKLDHYTHPALLMTGKNNTDEHFVMVDKILYRLWYCSDNCTSFKIVNYYIPMIEEMKKGQDKGKKKKKKGGFLNKLGGKLSRAMGGNPYMLAQQNVDHEKKVKDYFVAMKKVQKKHPYSSKIKSEIAQLKKDYKAAIDDINRTNADWWASEEGQAIKERDAVFAKKFTTIKNGRSYKITIGNGGAFKNTIGPGQTTQVDCNDSWYIYNGGSKGKIIASANATCGQTVTVN